MNLEIGELEVVKTASTSFVLTDKRDGTKYRFVAGKTSERDAWLSAIAREAITDSSGMSLRERGGASKGMGSDQMERTLETYADMHETGDLDFKEFVKCVGDALMLTFAPRVEGKAVGAVL